MSSDQLPTRKLQPAMSQLLDYMRAGARPRLRVGMPGSTIDLGDMDRQWRHDHNGQPVDPRTIQGLVSRGLVERTTLRRGLVSVYEWSLVDDSHNHGTSTDQQDRRAAPVSQDA